MRIAITGSHGLIGTALVGRLEREGHGVVRLPRAPISADGLSGSDAVVNLAGASIGGRRWNERYKEELRASRLRTTESLVAALAATARPPGVLVSASAVGYYGADPGDRVLSEDAAAGQDFLARLCVDWEAAARAAQGSGTRVVTTRFGLVLSAAGGVLARQLPLFRLGLGGRIGSGRQYQSWVTRTDAVDAIVFLLADPAAEGPFNVTAPNPVTNLEMASALGRAVHRPAALPLPAGALRLLLGREMAELVPLSGQRAVPSRLDAAGFRFGQPDLDSALSAALSDRRRR